MDRPATCSICSLAKVLWYDRNGANSCSAIVFEQAGSTVKVSTTSPLPRFGRVRLTMGGLDYFAKVESAQTGGQNNEAELTLQETRRSDERVPSRGPMKLSPVDPAQGEGFTVQASNYSRGGLQVVSPQPLAEELLVSLAADNIECCGVVRYCHRAAAGYLIGIELVEPPTVSA
jgi:PilZ domain